MIGLLSDAHGNYLAFNHTIDLLRKYGAEHFYFLGDSVGYLPTPLVVSALQALKGEIVCIRGNHEVLLLKEKIDPLREPVYQHSALRRKIDTSRIEFIQKWPLQIEENFRAGKALFVHGSPHSPTEGYIYPDTDLSPFRVDARFIFMGHTHLPFLRRCGETTFINIGSCGLPRDRGGLGSAALFNDRTGQIRIIRYDIRQETKNVIEEIDFVHPSVLELLQRKSLQVIGEIVENG